MKVAICISGFLRTWQQTRYSFEKIFCQGIQPDLYLHCYRENYYESSSGKTDQVFTDQEIHDMFRGLNIKKIMVESIAKNRQQVLDESMKYSHFPGFLTEIRESSDPNSKIVPLGSRIYDQLRVCHVANELLAESGIKYDVLVKTRYDVLYLNTPDWSSMTDGHLHCESGATGGFPPEIVVCGTPDVVDKTIMARYRELPNINGVGMCSHMLFGYLVDKYKTSYGTRCCEVRALRSEKLMHQVGIGTVPIQDYILEYQKYFGET